MCHICVRVCVCGGGGQVPLMDPIYHQRPSLGNSPLSAKLMCLQSDTYIQQFTTSVQIFLWLGCVMAITNDA